MSIFPDAAAVVRGLQPDEPVTLVRPHAAERAARCFVERFPGKTLYAVKANPLPALLAILWSGGIRQFDVDSLGEVQGVRELLPMAELCFMNPIKSEHAIARAYFDHGVRAFSLDCHEELAKILRSTRGATDLALCVRIRVSLQHAKQSMSAKFGVPAEGAPALMLATRRVADRLGLSFHVGSQAMSPMAYAEAMATVRTAIDAAAIDAAAVTVDFVDVGGGFPSIYPDMAPPHLASYFDTIDQAFAALPGSEAMALWSEPGRALCAEYTSLLVRVQKRRDRELFINDGAYGTLSEAGHIGWRYPVAGVGDCPSELRSGDIERHDPVSCRPAQEPVTCT